MTTKELKERLADLENILPEMMFWARRYCNGRSTYVPDVFRNHYKHIKKWMPELLPKYDSVIYDDYLHFKPDIDRIKDWLIDCNDEV